MQTNGTNKQKHNNCNKSLVLFTTWMNHKASQNWAATAMCEAYNNKIFIWLPH